ncbi:UvrD-helicase domain-containing protein [Clostridium tertium]|jgi:superfamily I DNA/RNA helicase|nr:ATP-dependent helicase [Clostridium sp.]
MTDSEIRKEIIKSNYSLVILAGAGSGKTTLLTNKIISFIEKNKTHYKVAAITFTQKAAYEIKTKLNGRGVRNFIGTNDSFVEQEIIRPFLTDVYGDEFSKDFIVTYSSDKFHLYSEGLNILKTKKALASYSNNKKNFKFQLALEILKKSIVAKQYMVAKYKWIFIDEYQDSDEDMHNLFMFIKELGVNLFIVGDLKQSLYSWRGAKPELFKSLYENDNGFKKFELLENFRCSKCVQNYANIIEYRDLSRYQDECREINVIGVENRLQCILDNLDLDKEISFLARRNDQAEEIKSELNSAGYNFTFIAKSPLDDLGTVNKNTFINLARYVKDRNYTHYDFVNNIAGDYSKKDIMKIKSIIEPLLSNPSEDDIERILLELFAFLGLVFYENIEIPSFIKSIQDSKYDNSFNGKSFKHNVMTIHSSKGLEFEQVVMYASDFKIHWNRDLNEHYVAVTRAKSKVIIVLDDNNYIKEVCNIVKSLGLEISKIIKIS